MNSRQLIIIEYAKQYPEFQTKDILEFFVWKFDVERMTVIRDLAWLVDQGMLTPTGKGRSVKYLFAETNKIFKPIDIDTYFTTPYDRRQVLTSFNFDIFEILQEVDIFSKPEIQKLEQLHQQFVSNISQYDSQTLINKEYERIMIEFSWKSSSIEWNTYSLLATEALLTANIPDASKTPEETQMILNHKDAFNETLLNLERFQELKLANIEYLHHVLTKKLWIGANIRKHSVWVTGTQYKPIDNQFQIQDALQAMTNLINYKSNFFEKAFIALLLISYIQAFEDGNKRTARMLTNAILLAHHSIPLSYRWVDIIEYKKATILFYEQNNLTYFKKIFIDQFEDAVTNYFS